MRRKSWIVGPYAIRPAGTPTDCFYCKAKLGDEHNPGCQLRQRTVVLRAVIDFTVTTQEDDDKGFIEFFWNDPEFYSGNVLSEIERLLKGRGAKDRLREAMTIHYLREATREDERRSRIRLEDKES